MTSLTNDQFKQARNDGKEIQFYNENLNEWTPTVSSFPLRGYIYRIKPEVAPPVPNMQKAGTPHVHAAVIKAWADGAEIECRILGNITWEHIHTPHWRDNVEYRVKPPREFPKSSLSGEQLWQAYYIGIGHNSAYAAVLAKPQDTIGNASKGMAEVAKAAIKQYILDTEAAK